MDYPSIVLLLLVTVGVAAVVEMQWTKSLHSEQDWMAEEDGENKVKALMALLLLLAEQRQKKVAKMAVSQQMVT